MALPSSVIDRENKKFVEDANGDVAVRTKASADAPTIPSGAATEAKQDDIVTELGQKLETADLTIDTLGAKKAVATELLDASGNQIVAFGASSFATYVSTTTTLTTANTAYLLPSSEQSGRKCLVIYNSSDTDVYWGDSSVTTSTGVLLEAGEKVAINSESGVYCVCGTNSKTVNVLEAK